MSSYDGLDGEKLDRHITGNYGQDQEREDPADFDDDDDCGRRLMEDRADAMYDQWRDEERGL